MDDDKISNTWNWFNNTEITMEAENIDPDFIEALYGQPAAPEHTVRIDVPYTDEDGNAKETTFVLYRVQFQPFKFNLWDKWYKKLARRVLGNKIAYRLFYRKAITVNYRKGGRSSGKPVDTVGRLVG